MKSEVQLDKIANTARTTMIYRLVHVIIIDSYSNTKDEQLLQNTAKELETITAFSKEIRDVAQHLSFSQLSNSSPTIR